MHGILLVDFTHHGATINVGHYQGTPTRLKGAVHHKRPTLLSQRAQLLHDNAWPDIAHTTVNLLNTWHWQILHHPPYSHDLAPLDFHLFLN
jgi:hypothetical protein